MMDITRNQFFLAGLLFLLIGVEMRWVDTFVLSTEFTQFLAERSGHPIASVSAATQSLLQTDGSRVQKSIHPPQWLGWALGSLGVVLGLHALGMKKP